MKLFRTTSRAVVKCCQLAFNFFPVHSQLDIRSANFLQKFIAYENRFEVFIIAAHLGIIAKIAGHSKSCNVT